MQAIEVALHPVPVLELRPAQMTIGLREVEAKHEELRRFSAADRQREIEQAFFPAVKGEGGTWYLVEDHHEARARLEEEPSATVLVGEIKDLSHLSRKAFWTVLDHFSWSHCYDARGRKRPWQDMPKTLGGMADDPYRSLAAAVRDRGGFAKTSEPYLEFLWADFLRDQIKADRLQSSWKGAVQRALKAAKSQEASHLPGWCGPS